MQPTEIRTSVSPSSAVELNTASALANYATEAEPRLEQGSAVPLFKDFKLGPSKNINTILLLQAFSGLARGLRYSKEWNFRDVTTLTSLETSQMLISPFKSPVTAIFKLGSWQNLATSAIPEFTLVEDSSRARWTLATCAQIKEGSPVFNKGFLERKWQPFLQTVRFRNRINIQRPRAPHYIRAKENPFERLLAREILKWFNRSQMVAFFHRNPWTAEDQFKAYVALKKQDMHLKIYGRSTLKMAVENTRYEIVLKLFESHNLLVFSAEPQVGKLLKLLKKIPQLTLLAGIVDGQFLSKKELVRYSALPDLQTSRAGLVTVINSMPAQIVQNLNHHQQTLVRHLQQHLEIQQKPHDDGAEVT
uniref:Large ribosomal subunit protein uL10m n=1 Tax=Timema californicum TaxID=61474 RepID=A0A7R9IWY0_TIMCA|nr:unnamed protein product [Timema californicum]